ncbi:MAG: ATP-dependent bile acid permease [Linnemannia gamsii]|nr:MAG: ATP-dependent bile acid permease [Linnemannia gamsii]
MDRAFHAGTRLDGHHFELKNFNLHFPVGELSIVTGPTGNGKTSMLLALLGEMNITQRRAFLPRRDDRTINTVTGLSNSIGYITQLAWLLNDSIRNSILFGSVFDQMRYDQVVEMCALKREILENGDETEIGEQGLLFLERVALARAVYSRAGHILLDDCISAVDAHTAKWLFTECLMGPLIVGRTRILVTHDVSLTLRSAAFGVVLKDGTVSFSSSPVKVLESGALDTDFLMDEQTQDVDDKTSGVALGSSSSTDGGAQLGNATDDDASATAVPVKEKKKLIEAKGKAEGALAKEVYLSYFRAMGKNMLWTVLLSSFFANQALQVSSDAWLRSLVKPMEGLSYYLGVYAFLSVILMIREIIQYTGSLHASRMHHRRVLDRVLYSSIRFFDITPLGRIINRFTRDMGTLYQQATNVSANVMVDFLGTLTVTGVIVYVTPQFLIPGLIIAVLFVVIAMFFTRTSRELRRHEAITNSPVYSHFAETLNGVTTVRAFGFEERFNSLYQELLDEHNRPYFYLWVCNRWLSVCVDILSAFMSLFAGIFVIFRRDTIDASAAGLSLTYSLALTHHVVWFVRTLAFNEINMNCVERVQEYMVLPQEAPAIIESHRPPVSWPTQGEIQVENLVMQYALDEPAVICDISFHVSPREKIGIVGRTGADKSTLAVAFFRFMEVTSGKIVIDGVDISQIGVHDLRSNLTIIPQDPVLFIGTVRSNLDPFQEHDDTSLWAALKRIHLVSSSSSSSSSDTNTPTDSPGNNNSNNNSGFGNLDSEVKENGNNFSQGLRQLIDLARALLTNSKIIIMDEATDAKTQATIRESCQDATLLTIAHRLRTIIDFDRVLVMDHGKDAQMDTPARLIREEGAVFRNMSRRSGEFELLFELATASERRGRGGV